MSSSSLPHRSTKVAGVAALLAMLAAGPVQAEDFSGFALDFSRDNNVSRSPADQAVGANSGELSWWHGYHWQVADHTGVELTGTLAHRQAAEPSALSTTRVSASAVVRHKFGVGTQVPELSLGSTIERNRSNDSRRDAWRYQVNAALRQRSSEQWQWTLSASYDQQDGDLDEPKALPPPLPSLPGKVWDTQGWQVALTAEWDLGPSWWLDATLTHRHGDIVSSVLPPTPILFASSAIALDPVFGSAIVAYRLPATTHMLAVNWNLATSDSSTIYLGLERLLSHGAGSLSYGVGIFRAGFIHNF